MDIAAERTNRGWTQATLAEMAEVHVRTLRRIEKGERVADTVLERVHAALGTDPGDVEPTQERIEASVGRIRASPYLPVGRYSLGLVVGLCFAMGAAYVVIMLVPIFLLPDRNPALVERGVTGALWATPFLVVGVVLLVRHFREQVRVEKALVPDCRTLSEGIAAGRVSVVEFRVFAIAREILGWSEMARACNSPLARVTVLTDGLPSGVAVPSHRTRVAT